MPNPQVIAIGLDAAEAELLEPWMSDGSLPNLETIRRKGHYSRLKGIDYFVAESPWTSFITGCLPQKTGYWGTVAYDPARYRARELAAYDFKEFPPFYALGPEFRVCSFDVPHSIPYPGVHGTQIIAWGAHSPLAPSASLPEALYAELVKKHGKHPALNKDFGVWWDKTHLHFLRKALSTGIERRAEISSDLLRREHWDLFLTVFSETHSAGHDLWFLSRPDHPLYGLREGFGFKDDPLLAIYKKIDGAVGRILRSADPNAAVVVFSTHGMNSNSNDLPSMLFLGEMLYRYSLPGESMYKRGVFDGSKLGTTQRSMRRGWTGDIWRRRDQGGILRTALIRSLPMGPLKILDRLFQTPAEQSFAIPFRQLGSLAWQPVTWYEPHWPRMRAFALPSYSEGYVRLNVQGRDARGLIPENNYGHECETISRMILGWRCARTKAPIARKVIRMRKHANENGSKAPDADLVVLWQLHAADAVEHPDYGRIGPMPYNRTGSHSDRGFILACGPGVRSGPPSEEGRSIDLAPTLLRLMGAKLPPYLDGKPLAFTTP